jgi:hypothetical protein
MNKIVSIALVIVGVVLIIFGVQATDRLDAYRRHRRRHCRPDDNVAQFEARLSTSRRKD